MRRYSSQRGNLPRPIVSAARRLRKDMSLPEVMLWQQLRQRPGGLKFRRQHPIDDYVADFCCLSRKLVVEIDGAVHDQTDAAAYDKRRDARIRRLGFEIIRIPAADILKDSIVAAQSILAIAETPLRPADAAHLPGPGRI